MELFHVNGSARRCLEGQLLDKVSVLDEVPGSQFVELNTRPLTHKPNVCNDINNSRHEAARSSIFTHIN